MIGQKYKEETPIRSRNKNPGAADNTTCSTRASSVRRSSYQHHIKPWFSGSNYAMAVAAASSTALSGGTSSTSVLSLINSANSKNSIMMDLGKNLNNVGTTTESAAGKNIDKSDVRPIPYHNYNPVVVRHIQKDNELPIHYWFYIYLHSSDVDKLLTPFAKMEESFGPDRRLVVIMNRYGVQILLKELELYKSLPRRIVVIKGSEWSCIVKAILEMEERLPELMRFATFPMLLDTDTTKYACTKFDRTACINRLSKIY